MKKLKTHNLREVIPEVVRGLFDSLRKKRRPVRYTRAQMIEIVGSEEAYDRILRSEATEEDMVNLDRGSLTSRKRVRK